MPAWPVRSHMRHKDFLRSPGVAASSKELYEVRTYHSPLSRALGFSIDADDAVRSRRHSEAPVEHQTIEDGWILTTSLGIVKYVEHEGKSFTHRQTLSGSEYVYVGVL